MANRSAIMQIFYGERGKMDQVQPSARYFEIMEEFNAAETEFFAKWNFTEEMKDDYSKLGELTNSLWSMDIDQYYAEGFRFGVLLAFDVLSHSNDKE